MTQEAFPIQFSFKGRTISSEATAGTTATELVADVRMRLELPDPSTTSIKILYKGKRVYDDATATDEAAASVNVPVFATIPRKITPKLMVLVTQKEAVQAMNAKRSDPTIRGFDQDIDVRRRQAKLTTTEFWGPGRQQDGEYKFCRCQACTWQSFGHRPVDSTPHDFAARNLLERLATDPGVVAVMKTRQLVVGTLGEMDPIDDRLMQQKQQEGGVCLLGYNTNAGQRIEIKLRTDDLKDFRPYPELVMTLLHELSHNWVGEHNLLFWTNYAQMRAEYLFTHAHVTSGVLVQGKTTAQLAGVPAALRTASDVYQYVVQELVREMAQHRLHPNLLAQGFQQHCLDLEAKAQQRIMQANTLGGTSVSLEGINARDLALAAAERRAKEQREQQEEPNETKKPKK